MHISTFLKIALDRDLSFSYIVGRMGKLESIDVKLFCAAAMDFYRTQVRRFLQLKFSLILCLLSGSVSSSHSQQVFKVIFNN